MRQEAQRPRGRDLRILLAKRPRRGVARVGEDLAALRLLPLVERGESILRHIDLAAHLEDRRRAGQSLRNVGNRPHVRPHILADAAVPARRREHQLACFITQRTGQPVDLGLGGERDGRVGRKAQESPYPRDKLDHFLRRERIFQAQHRSRMGNLGERRGRGRTHAERRRIRPHQMRKLRLERRILADERIIIRVRNRRCIAVVIEPVVQRDLLRQPHQPIGGVGLVHPNTSPSICVHDAQLWVAAVLS